MCDENLKHENSPEHQALVPSPINGVVPPIAHRWKRGESGNPGGRKTAGATVKEHINQMAEAGLSEQELRSIAKSKSEPWPRRAAANRILRTLEVPDMADFQDAADGVADLKSLRDAGLNTEVVKKVRSKTRTITPSDGGDPVVEVEREIELFDRAGEDFDRIMDRTEGKAKQATEISGPNGGPIQTEGVPDYSKLSPEELRQLLALAEKVTPMEGA